VIMVQDVYKRDQSTVEFLRQVGLACRNLDGIDHVYYCKAKRQCKTLLPCVYNCGEYEGCQDIPDNLQPLISTIKRMEEKIMAKVKVSKKATGKGNIKAKVKVGSKATSTTNQEVNNGNLQTTIKAIKDLLDGYQFNNKHNVTMNTLCDIDKKLDRLIDALRYFNERLEKLGPAIEVISRYGRENRQDYLPQKATEKATSTSTKTSRLGSLVGTVYNALVEYTEQDGGATFDEVIDYVKEHGFTSDSNLSTVQQYLKPNVQFVEFLRKKGKRLMEVLFEDEDGNQVDGYVLEDIED